jgi:HEAT repeat protein
MVLAVALAVAPAADEPKVNGRLLGAWLAQLRDADPKKRAEAAGSLGLFGRQAGPAVPHLAAALKDPQAEVRAVAAHALGRLGPTAQAAAPQLIASSPPAGPPSGAC